MKAPRKKPFVITHNPHRKGMDSDSSKSILDSRESQSSEKILSQAKKNTHIELQNQIILKKTVFKNCYNMFQITPNLLSDLLQKYANDNVRYREEGFTQQADRFLMKMSIQKRIPKEIRLNFPLYEIFVSLSKIFMLNEYEIVVLGCALDHCSWKIDEAVFTEETEFLKEFPGNFAEEFNQECKRLIIYLLVITFSLKQYLNEKSISDRIHAYCESICTNFQALFNRWTRVTYYQKFSYSPIEINRKFRDLSQQEILDQQPTTVADYNVIAESIMELSGSYKSKIANQQLQQQQHQIMAPYIPVQSVFQNINPTPSIIFPPINDQRSIFANLSLNLPLPALEKNPSKPKTIDLSFDTYDLPDIDPISRRSSSSNMLGDFGRKKLKPNPNPDNLGFTSLMRDSSFLKELNNAIGSGIKNNEVEDFFANIPLPSLSKKSSNMSQVIEEQPSLFKFHSNYSSSWNKESF